MDITDIALNNTQGLISHKFQPNQKLTYLKNKNISNSICRPMNVLLQAALNRNIILNFKNI